MKFSATLSLALAPLAVLAGREDSQKNRQQDKNVVLVEDGMRGHGISKNARTEIIIIWANPGGGAQTTTINEKVTVTQTVTVPAGTAHGTATAPVAGASHTVTVGGPGGLVFAPDQLNKVPVGDFVVFEFLAQNHTVTQSGFETPCDPLAGGMDSGFMANPNNTVSPPPQIAMQVMVDTPLWFYCKQGNHCGKGMVFSINPTVDKTQAMFQALAIKQKGNGAQSPITGGQSSAPVQSKPAGTSAAPPAGTSAVGGSAPPPPAATSPSAPAQGTGVVTAPGKVGSDGSCVCVVACAAGSFPALEAQGVGAFGGQAGGLPVKMAAIQ